MHQVYEENGYIKTPKFHSKLRFTFESKTVGEQRTATIVKSAERNLFYAYFVDDDVDFKIEIDNTECAEKNSACLSMEVLEKIHKVLVNPKEKAILNKLEPEGKKLHFISKKSQEKQVKTKTRGSNGTATSSSSDSKINIHQIKFTFRYSRNHILNITMPEEKEEVPIKPLKLTVLPTTTIKEIKRKIEKRRQILTDIQILHSSRGKELFFDYQTVYQSGIVNYDYIHITRDTPVQIKIKLFPLNTTITTSVYARDSLEKLVEKVEKQEGIRIKGNSLYFRGIPILDHDPVALSLEDLTIEDLKLNKTDTDTDTILFAIVNDEETNSKQQSKKQKLMITQHHKNKETYSPFPITIKNCNNDNKLLSIDVCGSDTIGQLKHKIQKKFKIPVTNQKLRFKNARGSFKLQDHVTLEIYDIKEGSELKLNQICDQNGCRNPGGKFIIKDLCGLSTEVAYYCGCDFIEELKDSIQLKMGIFLEEQQLIYDDKELIDADQIFQYKIPNNSTIHLVRRLEQEYKSPFECNCIQKRKCQMCPLNHTLKFDHRSSLISGRKSDKIFSSAIDFVPERSYQVESFIVEFRTY